MNNSEERHSFSNSIAAKLRGPRYFGGQLLTVEDTTTVVDAQLLWLCVVRDVCVRFECDFTRTFALARELPGTDVKVLMSALDLITELLQRDVVDRKLSGVEQWKTVLAERGLLLTPITVLLGLIKPIFNRWRQKRDADAWGACYQVTKFLKKLSLRNVEELSEVALAGWQKTEDELRVKTDTFPERKVISRWFPKKKLWKIIQGFAPRHGNGSVAERVHTLAEKYGKMVFTEAQVALLRKYGLDDIVQTLHVNVVADAGPCMVVFVPKSWKTFRTISMEPAGTMFLQQGFVAGLEDRIRAMARGSNRRFRNWNISDYYCLTTEDNNRDAALMGSIVGDVSTVDLSAASDSVSWDLVRALFRDSALMDMLEATRTQYAYVGVSHSGTSRQKLVKQKKFAPMGSRFCFPIETIVFASVVEAIRQKHKGEYDDPFYMNAFNVFGDDITIPTPLVPELYARLDELGFRVNTEKSFSEDHDESPNHFRESCGAEYLNGISVAPKTIGRQFAGLLHPRKVKLTPYGKFPYDPATIARLIAMANDLVSFPTARAVLTKNLISDCRLPLMWDETGETGLCVIDGQSPVVHPIRIEFEQDWYTHLGLMFVQQPTYDNGGPLTDEMRLFEHLRITRKRKRLLYPEDRVDVRMAPYQDPMVVLTWVNLDGMTFSV